MKKHLSLVCLLFLFAGAKAQSSWIWAKDMKSTSAAIGAAMEAGPEETFYLQSNFFDTVWVEGAMLTSDGIGDFLTRYDRNGNVIWRKVATGRCASFDLEKDAAGNLYRAGVMMDTVMFDTFMMQLPGKTGCFLAKFDSSGNALWSRTSEGPGPAYGLDVETLPNGDLMMLGVYMDSLYIGDTLLVDTSGATFLVQYSAAGDYIRAKSIRIREVFDFYSADFLETDADGNLYIGFSYQDTCWLESNLIIPQNNRLDYLVAKYDANFNLLWYKGVTGPHDDQGWDMSLAANGNLFITGWTGDTANVFGTPRMNNDQTINGYIACLSPTGSVIWNKPLIADDVIGGMGIQTDPQGGIIWQGFLKGTTNFEGSPLSSAPQATIMIARFDQAGNLQWFNGGSGDCNYAFVNEIILDSKQNLLTTGWFEDSLKFGNTLLYDPLYTNSLFLAKFFTALVGNEPDAAAQAPEVFPNPASGSIAVRCGITGKLRSRVLDLSGREVLESEHSSSSFVLDISALSPGIYLLELEGESARASRKIVVY